MIILGLILLGLTAGTLSGLIGIGGGVLIVPALVYIFGITQKTAQGTTLAMFVLPIGLISAATYYKNGFVDLKVTGLLIIGFLLGSIIGSKMAIKLPSDVITKIFGIAIILIGLKMLFSK